MTHKEVFNTWFKTTPDNVWFRVMAYNPNNQVYYFTLDAGCTLEELTEMESSEFPREE